MNEPPCNEEDNHSHYHSGGILKSVAPIFHLKEKMSQLVHIQKHASRT